MIEKYSSLHDQRKDYTFKENIKNGRHGWLRLTPAYSISLVEGILKNSKKVRSLLDPFSGTATTALCASYAGHRAVTIDINPFLVWLGQAKLRIYSSELLNSLDPILKEIIDNISFANTETKECPPIHNIERWWPKNTLSFLGNLSSFIEQLTLPGSETRDLLQIAFCRTLIECSNASFCHQSMSFKEEKQQCFQFDIDLKNIFQKNVSMILRGALQNPKTTSQIFLSDARDMSLLHGAPFDLVLTSPPYVNRMSYIRELRPYMYWLKYLHSGRDAGELDWQAIGGTWGIATSRLADWQSDTPDYLSKELQPPLEKITEKTNSNGVLMAKYVKKYFFDMHTHFKSLSGILSNGAEVHYIIGNSSFYGHLIPVEKIYCSILEHTGFTKISATPLRKRNSKKELIEFDVSGTFLK